MLYLTVKFNLLLMLIYCYAVEHTELVWGIWIVYSRGSNSAVIIFVAFPDGTL